MHDTLQQCNALRCHERSGRRVPKPTCCCFCGVLLQCHPTAANRDANTAHSDGRRFRAAHTRAVCEGDHAHHRRICTPGMRSGEADSGTVCNMCPLHYHPQRRWRDGARACTSGSVRPGQAQPPAWSLRHGQRQRELKRSSSQRHGEPPLRHTPCALVAMLCDRTTYRARAAALHSCSHGPRRHR